MITLKFYLKQSGKTVGRRTIVLRGEGNERWQGECNTLPAMES
jgi:hypothetical protein